MVAVLDITLVLALAMVAVRAIHASMLFTGIILYIVFGVILALIWVRLEAPDLAIAEAAIGAGITGAILLDAARQFGERPPLRHARHAAKTIGAALGAAVGVAVLASIFLPLEGRRSGLSELVATRLDESGVEHPVTAVLLNFRGYDTWLEVGVLLVASLGVLALRTPDGHPRSSRIKIAPPAVATGTAAILAPVGILIAGYLLWRGSHGPGGAFQAGAVLGAVAVLFALLGRTDLTSIPPRIRTATLIAGFQTFLGAGLFGVVQGGAFLEWDSTDAGTVILLIESAVALSVAMTLALLFLAAREVGGEPEAGRG